MGKKATYKLSLVITITLGITTIPSFAQNNILTHPDFFYRLEPGLFLNNKNYYEVKPMYFSLHRQDILIDSLYILEDYEKDLYLYSDNRKTLKIDPIWQEKFQIMPFADHTQVGVRFEGELGKYLKFNLNLVCHAMASGVMKGTRTDSAGVIYHWGKYYNIGDKYNLFFPITGRVRYKVNKFLEFEGGHDKHFWGDGYRSLLLSDNAPPFSFFSSYLNIWRLKYTSTFTLLKDYKLGEYDNPFYKYAVFHLISTNISKKLNISFFEALLWYRKDSANQAYLGINYFNPFSILRPTELNNGSPDNAIKGFGVYYQHDRRTTFYGQLMIDDFRLSEFLKGKRWWANKNGFQLGFKYYDLFDTQDLSLQMEYSQVRPFTYTHNYPAQNYAYMMQPLAHPLSSNFREIITIVRYPKNRWYYSGMISFHTYGAEPGGRTIGYDLYISSTQKKKVYYNYLGQGTKTNQLGFGFKAGRVLHAKWSLVAESGIKTLFQFSPVSKQQILFDVGIRTLLYREEKLF